MLSHCRVVACRSFMPAYPIARDSTPRRRARTLMASKVVSERFSIQRKVCSPEPVGV